MTPALPDTKQWLKKNRVKGGGNGGNGGDEGSESGETAWRLIMLSTFTFLVAFAWNSAAQSVFRLLGKEGSVMWNLMYATVVTIIVIGAIYFLDLDDAVEGVQKTELGADDELEMVEMIPF